MKLPNVTKIGAFYKTTGVRVYEDCVMIGRLKRRTRLLQVTKRFGEEYPVQGEFGEPDDYPIPRVLEGISIARATQVVIVPHLDFRDDYHSYVMLVMTEGMGHFSWNLFADGRAPWLP